MIKSVYAIDSAGYRIRATLIFWPLLPPPIRQTEHIAFVCVCVVCVCVCDWA